MHDGLDNFKNKLDTFQQEKLWKMKNTFQKATELIKKYKLFKP